MYGRTQRTRNPALTPGLPHRKHGTTRKWLCFSNTLNVFIEADELILLRFLFNTFFHAVSVEDTGHLPTHAIIFFPQTPFPSFTEINTVGCWKVRSVCASVKKLYWCNRIQRSDPKVFLRMEFEFTAVEGCARSAPFFVPGCRANEERRKCNGVAVSV